ncbi:MAG: hypothetical protein M3O30_01330 [Planctomycetota bacterium]|nr:hypothetical protein [Planctomycetota bacterium]
MKERSPFAGRDAMGSKGEIRADQIAAVLRRAAAVDHDLREHPPKPLHEVGRELVDAILVTPTDDIAPQKLFNRLRWGGQVVFATPDAASAVNFSLAMAACGFEITQAPSHVAVGWLGIPFLSRKSHFVVARKVELVASGQSTERFTYHVHLSRPSNADEYIVVKEVPTPEMVMARLRGKWPDLEDEVLEKRARKFSEKVFPIFLTREAAILKIVNRDLPQEYRNRMPRLLALEKDKKGYARKLHLNWLRNGGKPLTQLEFAHQSADLLRVLHDKVGVMHLDLRLDNFVITSEGVGFVDFGSAVRVNENLKESPLLSSMFQELMRTSEIQRMLFSMTRSGEVTSTAISCGLHKVDKAVDYFYLAVQINSPHKNPELKDLILYDKSSEQARRLSQLTDQILRPADPMKPLYGSAADMLRGIEAIERSIPDVQTIEA